MSANRLERLGKAGKALVEDYGRPAYEYIVSHLPDVSPQRLRSSLEALVETGDPLVRKSLKEAQAAQTAVRPVARAAPKVVVAPVRKRVPARPKAPPAGRQVQPSLVVDVDPRFAKRDPGDIEPLRNLKVGLSDRRFADPEALSIFDMEGRPFMTSMSDWAAAGDDILSINDVDLANPVQRRGGQDYMFDPLNPGAVWANNNAAVTKHLDLAQKLKSETGQDPLFMPWSMGPTGINFSHTPRELMAAYENATLTGKAKRGLDQQIRDIIGPDFKSIEDPESMALVTRVPKPGMRAELDKLLHERWKSEGLGLGPTRLAATDLDQMGLPALDLRNVGIISSDTPPSASTHPSFPVAIPGEGIGRLREPVAALSLLPDVRAEKGIDDPRVFPVGVVKGAPSPRRAMEFKPYGGVITEDMLRGIEERGYACGGPVRGSLAVRQ